MRWMTPLAAMLALAVGCDEGELKGSDTAPAGSESGTTPVSETEDTGPADDTEDTEDTEGTTSDAVTWQRDVRPFVESHCVRCHQEGGLGPVDFSTYELASAYSASMLVAMEAGDMPPPAADPSCRDYEGSEQLVLPDGAIEVFAAWVDAGTPEGDVADYVPVEPLSDVLVDADVEAFIPAPYTPVYADPTEPGNEYRCFVLDIGHTEDIYLTGLAPLVDAAEIIHHAVLFKKPASEVEGVGPDGFECMDERNTVTQMVHGWAPGALPMEMPEGAGIKLDADEVLVVQWHYYEGTNPGVTDQSGYALRTAPAVDKELSVYPFGPYDFTIPAGDDAYSSDLSYPIPFDGTIYAVFPHMHILGSGYEMTVSTAKEGDVCVVASDRYDFYNQLTYTLKEPVSFPGWSWLTMECTWNNSTSNPELIYNPPIDIGWGERTDEEMCFGFMLVDFTLF
jgi:hypothetical protein